MKNQNLTNVSKFYILTITIKTKLYTNILSQRQNILARLMHLMSTTASHKFTTSHQSSEQCVLRVLEWRLLISTATDLRHLTRRSRSQSDSMCTFWRRNTWSCKSHLVIRQMELWDIPVRCSISLGLLLDPGLPSWLHISSATHSIIFCSVLTVHGRPLPALRSIKFVL